MASLLTGRYPIEHRLHRHSDRIQPTWTQAQELYKKAGYRTAFLSANPSIMRNSGLARSFDWFEDSAFLNQVSYTTRFTEQTKQLLNWIDESDDPFFAVIYNSDLETLLDEDIGSAKLEDFDDKLGQFILTLKKNNLWESNYIIVAGLQGKSEYERPGETTYSNIHSENMNVAFFVKPPRQKGDEGISLKVDSLRTLPDFGLSLMKLAHPALIHTPTPEFDVVDDSELWASNNLSNLLPDQPQRNILLEAANTWSAQTELRFGIISGHSIYIEDETDQMFNRLNDGLETINIAEAGSEAVTPFSLKLSALHESLKVKKWVSYTNGPYEWVSSHHRYWFQSSQRNDVFEKERQRLSQDKQTQPLSTLLIYYLNTKKEKDSQYDEARRASYNLALENRWGLWDPNRVWPHPVTTENQ